uniref:Uncharacterized protein n=1 Tax=Anguilla anguilla TaxID=7936 RepID=A0A0E9QV26_ANGAN
MFEFGCKNRSFHKAATASSHPGRPQVLLVSVFAPKPATGLDPRNQARLTNCNRLFKNNQAL